jgi:hypothetical protein
MTRRDISSVVDGSRPQQYHKGDVIDVDKQPVRVGPDPGDNRVGFSLFHLHPANDYSGLYLEAFFQYLNGDNCQN